MPASRAGTRWPGRSPWPERNWRISVTSRISEPISASAAGSLNSKAGQAAIITESSPVSAHHSSSVTNGITGCSSRSIWSSTNPSTRAASRPRRLVARCQRHLGQLQVPVAELVPREVVQRLARLAELELLEQPVDLGDHGGQAGKDPAVGGGVPRIRSAESDAAPRRPAPRR